MRATFTRGLEENPLQVLIRPSGDALALLLCQVLYGKVLRSGFCFPGALSTPHFLVKIEQQVEKLSLVTLLIF